MIATPTWWVDGSIKKMKYIDAEKIANHLLNIQQYCDKNKERLSKDFIIQKIFETAIQLLYELKGEDVIPISTVAEHFLYDSDYCEFCDDFNEVCCGDANEVLGKCDKAVEKMIRSWKNE